MRHYCLGGCSALSVCAQRSRLVRGARAGTWCCVPPVSPFPPRVSRAACGGPSCPGVPYPHSLVRHSTWSVRSASSVWLPFCYSPRALCVCVRSRSRGVRSAPPWVMWRAHFARSRHWALVGPFHVVSAPPRVLPRSLAPSGVLGGGQSGPGSPLPGFGLCAPRGAGLWRLCAGGRVGGGEGGGPCASCCGRGCAAVGSRRCPLGLHALWGPRSAGMVGAVPGGVARHRCEGRLVSGAVPPPVARPLGGPSGSATHMLWARVCGCGGPALSPQPACPVGAACCEGRGGPPPRGVACYRCGGRLVSDAVPPPAARPLGQVAGVLRPVCPRRGRCGRGDPAPGPQRAPLLAGVARRGGGGRVSPGGCLSLLRGASDVRRSPSPDCPPTGRAVGVHYPRAVGAGAWVWGPNAVPLACMPCGGCVPRGWRGAVSGGGGLPLL